MRLSDLKGAVPERSDASIKQMVDETRELLAGSYEIVAEEEPLGYVFENVFKFEGLSHIKSDVTRALKELMGNKGWTMDGVSGIGSIYGTLIGCSVC